MSQPIRAVYKDGQLRLLDSVDLTDGQQVQVMILSDSERVRAALGDLLVKFPAPAQTSEGVDEQRLMQEIEAAFEGQPPLSETLIEERREGR